MIEETNNKELKVWADLKNIDVIIDKKLVLSNINIKLRYGENILILGPNGSGKSTFLKLINRSIYPIFRSASSLTLFNNKNINIWDIRSKVGFIFKEMEERVNKGVSVYEVISSGFSGTYNSRNMNLLSQFDISNIHQLISNLDLEDIKHIEFNKLSDGQKRRVLLARSLVYKPRLLVLDEPFCNLDIKSNQILNNVLLDLINKSVNIIYVTHSLESVLPQTNRVILIKKGKVINDGSPEEMLSSKILSELYDTSIKVVKYQGYWRSIPIRN